MKTWLSALAVVLAVSAPAGAETLVFPSAAPVASVTFPDTWKAEEIDTGGIQAFSPDDAISFYVEISKMAEREKAAGEAFKFLADNGVTFDADKDDKSEGTINGMPVAVHNFDGKDENGPVTIGLYIFGVSPETALVATYWGVKGEQDKFGEDMNAIINSVKPAGS